MMARRSSEKYFFTYLDYPVHFGKPHHVSGSTSEITRTMTHSDGADCTTLPSGELQDELTLDLRLWLEDSKGRAKICKAPVIKASRSSREGNGTQKLVKRVQRDVLELHVKLGWGHSGTAFTVDIFSFIRLYKCPEMKK
jgi:hypothetical protein